MPPATQGATTGMATTPSCMGAGEMNTASDNRSIQSGQPGWTLLFACWLLALAGMLGSLFFSEVMGLPPCVLCWWQRIFMYPLVIILLVRLFNYDQAVIRYALPLAVLGWLTAFYHYLVYSGYIPESLRIRHDSAAFPGCLHGNDHATRHRSKQDRQMNKQSLVLLAGGALVTIFAIAAYLYNQQQAEEANARAMENASTLVRDYAPRKGNPDAKVTIVEFFDPACETCRAFHPFVKQLMAAHPGKVNLVLRYAMFHPGSDYVVKILEASRLQGKFWETLETTLDAQPVWASHREPQPERLWMRLGGTGLDFQKLKADMESTEIARRLQQDTADVRTLQVTKTPSFFVNGKPLTSFGYEQLRTLVEDEVHANY